MANEWLTNLTEQFQAAHPHCRCLALEWSVWSGVGMGQRLELWNAQRQAALESELLASAMPEAVQKIGF